MSSNINQTNQNFNRIAYNLIPSWGTLEKNDYYHH